MCAYDGPACLILLYQQEVLRGYCKQKSPGHRGWSDWCVCAPCARVRMPCVLSAYNTRYVGTSVVRPRADPQSRARDAHHRNRWRGTHYSDAIAPRAPEVHCTRFGFVLFCFFTANRTYLQYSHRYIIVYYNTSRLYMHLFFIQNVILVFVQESSNISHDSCLQTP